MLNWDHFRYMIAVAENGSVSKAAVALEVSHATVLRAISRLEKELQVRLFDPVKTGYRLTADGDDILIDARLMQNNVQQIMRKAKSRDSVPSGSLNIVIPDSTLYNMMPLLKTFTERYQQININTLTGSISKPLDFIEQQIDVLILISNAPPETLVGRQLTHIPFGAFASKHYMESAHKHNPNIRDWITWTQSRNDGDELYMYQQQLLLQEASITKEVLKAASHNDALHAVSASLGVSYLSKNAETAKLVEIAMPKAHREFGLWVLTHPDFRSAARVTALMRFLADHLAENKF